MGKTLERVGSKLVGCDSIETKHCFKGQVDGVVVSCV